MWKIGSIEKWAWRERRLLWCIFTCYFLGTSRIQHWKRLLLWFNNNSCLLLLLFSKLVTQIFCGFSLSLSLLSCFEAAQLSIHCAHQIETKNQPLYLRLAHIYCVHVVVLVIIVIVDENDDGHEAKQSIKPEENRWRHDKEEEEEEKRIKMLTCLQQWKRSILTASLY